MSPRLLPALLCTVMAGSALASDWPQWRGPQRNGVLPSGPRLVENIPAEGLPSVWESEPIPSNDDGGLSSPVVAGGRVYLSVVWHSDVPSETRQIDELTLRQLGYQNVNPLGKELIAKMEETRLNLSPTLRGKKLDDFATQWVEQNIPDKKQRTLYGGFVAGRFRKGKVALPLEVLQALDKHTKEVFPNEAAMRQWLDARGWDPAVVQQIAAAVPPTKRVAEDVILCLDLATGKTLWKMKAPGEPTGRNSSSTPCVAEGKVFAIGSTHAYCAEAATGRQLWATPLAQKGAGSSPLYVDGVVVVNAKHLTGLDAAAGRELWRQEKAGGGNSSPIAWTSGEQTLVLCNGRQDLAAVDLRTGAVAWSVPGGGDATPAVHGALLAVQTRKADLGVVAYKLSPTAAERVWNYPMDPLRSQSSPLIHEGLVFLMDDNNSFCFDLANGSQRWQEPLPSTISSPILADGKIFALVNNGNNVAIMKPDSAGRVELARATVRGAWVPSPAIAEGKLLVRLKDKLKCYDIAAK